MKETRNDAEVWVKADEGGYSNDPHDRGGPTKYGITIWNYREYFKKPKATAADVKTLTLDQAFEIYRKGYWDPVHADDLPFGVDYFTFDCAIHSGPGAAIRWLQRAVGVVPDGVIGPKTLEAVRSDHPLDIVAKMESLRRMRLRSLPSWRYYSRGWTNRINKAASRARKLIAAHPELQDAHPTPAEHIGDADDVSVASAPLNPKLEENKSVTTAVAPSSTLSIQIAVPQSKPPADGGQGGAGGGKV